MYQQRTLAFDAPIRSDHDQVATATSLPPPAIAASTSDPYSFDDFKRFHRSMSEGTISFENYQDDFKRLLVSKEAVSSELKSRFNAKQLAVLASRMGSWHARGNTKVQNADYVYERMLSAFLLESAVTFRMGERYEDALKAKVFAVTPADLATEFEKRKAKTQEHAKALTNPETYFEFRTFLQSRTEADLTVEQLARYDSLHADSTRERRQSEATTTVTKFESDELVGHEFQISEGFQDRGMGGLPRAIAYSKAVPPIWSLRGVAFFYALSR